MEIVIIRKNKAILAAKTCLWRKVAHHSLFSNRVEFNPNPLRRKTAKHDGRFHRKDKHIRVRPKQVGTDRKCRSGERLDRQPARNGARDRRRSTGANGRRPRSKSASLFTAQAIARDLIATGRENDVEEIREFISTIVPDPACETSATTRTRSQSSTAEAAEENG